MVVISLVRAEPDVNSRWYAARVVATYTQLIKYDENQYVQACRDKNGTRVHKYARYGKNSNGRVIEMVP